MGMGTEAVSAIGGMVAQIGSLFAKKPNLPQWVYDTPGSGLGKVTAGNLQNLPGATKLGTAVDTYNLDEMLRLAQGVKGLLPSLDLMKQIGTDWAGGKMSAGELRGIQQDMAAKNLSGGVAGSVFGSLGEVMQRSKQRMARIGAGLNTLQNWTTMTSAMLLPKPFDITKQMFDAVSGTNFLEKEKEQRWKGQLMQATAPAVAPAWSQGLAQVSSMIGGSGGGGGGGNSVPDFSNKDFWYWPK
jgi:hypothetical protein